MSPRRRFQTEVTETDDQGGLAKTNVPETEGPDRWARRLRVPSHGHLCVRICLGLTFRRRMSQTDVPETDDGDGGPRLMPQTDVPETDGQDGSKE